MLGTSTAGQEVGIQSRYTRERAGHLLPEKGEPEAERKENS